MGNLARQLGTEVVEKIHERMVQIAVENKIVSGRKMRVDTTVDVATLCYTSLSL